MTPPVVMRVHPAQKIRAESPSHSARSSNRAASGSSSELSSHQMAIRSRSGSSKNARSVGIRIRADPDHQLDDFFLVSSVSVLANVSSAKDFSLRGGGSWCAFPAVLPSS